MESLIEPGKIVEIGSEEWKVHVLNERIRAKENIGKLEKEISMLNNYILSLIKTEMTFGR